MKREPFTFRERLAAGAELSEIRERVASLFLVVGNAYGKGKAAKLVRAHRLLSQVASDLDNIVNREVPRHLNAVDGISVIKVYYGWRESPNRACAVPTEKTERDKLRFRAAHVLDFHDRARDSGAE